MLSFVAKLLPGNSAAALSQALSIPHRRNFDAVFQPAQDATDPRSTLLQGNEFKPEEGYFSVRIVEMRIAEAGNYIAQFLPMCSCFLRYGYGTSTREIPFIISYDMIRQLMGSGPSDGGGCNIDFKNVYVVRNAPFKAGGVSMYTALCRISDSSFARGMLDLIGDTAAYVGGPAMAAIAKTGVSMTKRLAALMGSDGVHTRFGVYDGDAVVRSGYRVIAGAGLDASKIEMSGGQLRRIDESGNPTSMDDVDYLVVAIEHTRSLLDQPFGSLSQLPFHSKWTDLTAKLVRGDGAGADETFNQLASDIVASPDLIEADRLGVLTGYASQMERWRQVKSGARPVAAGERNLRSAVVDAADSLSDVHKEASASLLRKAAKHIDNRSEAVDDAARLLSDAALGERMKAVGGDIRAVNATLADTSKATAEFLRVAYSRPPSP